MTHRLENINDSKHGAGKDHEHEHAMTEVNQARASSSSHGTPDSTPTKPDTASKFLPQGFAINHEVPNSGTTPVNSPTEAGGTDAVQSRLPVGAGGTDALAHKSTQSTHSVESADKPSSTNPNTAYDQRFPFSGSAQSSNANDKGGGNGKDVPQPPKKPFVPTDSHTFDLTRAWDIPKF